LNLNFHFFFLFFLEVTDFQTELTKNERKYLKEEENDEEQQAPHLRKKIKKIFKVTITK